MPSVGDGVGTGLPLPTAELTVEAIGTRSVASAYKAVRALIAATLPADAASAAPLDHLRRRRALMDRWLGRAGATVLDQFAQLLRASQAERVHLAIGAWIARHAGPDAALAQLRTAVQSLDTDPSKGTAARRPAPVAWLMDEFGLAGVDDAAPGFGLALAGAAEDGSEPWRRAAPATMRHQG